MGPAQNAAAQVAEEAAPWQKGENAAASDEKAQCPDGQTLADPPSDVAGNDQVPIPMDVEPVAAKPSEAAAPADEGDGEKPASKYPKGPTSISFKLTRARPTLGPLCWELERWTRHKWASWQHQEEVKWATVTEIFEEVASKPRSNFESGSDLFAFWCTFLCVVGPFLVQNGSISGSVFWPRFWALPIKFVVRVPKTSPDFGFIFRSQFGISYEPTRDATFSGSNGFCETCTR